MDLAQHLSAYVGSDAYADVVFVVEGQRIPGHRVVLCRSPFFKQLFDDAATAASTQSASASGGAPEFVVDNVLASTFLLVLRYVYSGTVEMEPKQALEIVQCADRFTVPEMKALCINRVASTLSVDNVCSVLQLAHDYEAAELKQTCLQFVRTNYRDIVTSSGFRSLARELIVEVLRTRAT